MLTTTLCYIENNGRYLMMHRVTKKNDANLGKWIGIGGKVNEGESEDECVVREVFEETGIVLESFIKRGVIDFVSDIYPEEIMHLYTASVDSDYFVSKTNEGLLEWVPIEQIPSLPVWEGDRIFLDLILKDSPPFYLRLIYQGDKLISYELKEIAQ